MGHASKALRDAALERSSAGAIVAKKAAHKYALLVDLPNFNLLATYVNLLSIYGSIGRHVVHH